MGETEKGKRTREAILSFATSLASVEGLEGLTIGRLATELDMSKSGLFRHFGSKEELQLAVVDTARQIFIDEVVTPARQAPSGLTRLWALCDDWLAYVEREVFPGGCFFMAAAAEFDNRPGPVRDVIASNMQEWLGYLEHAARRAQEQGEITPEADPAQIAFELHAFYLGANWAEQLFGDRQATARARKAILHRLHELATETAPPLPRAP